MPASGLARRFLPAAAALLAAAWAVPCAGAGETLAQVKARGTVRCGVSEGIAGFPPAARAALGRVPG